MSLVLPVDVEGVAVSRALGRAAVWAGSIFLACSLVLVIALRLIAAEQTVVLGLVGLGVVGLGMALALVSSSRWAVLAFVVLASAGLFTFTYSIAMDSATQYSSDSVIFALPTMAITVVGVAGLSLASALARCTLGFVFGTVAVQTASALAGMAVHVDVPSTLTYLGVLVLLMTLWLGRRQSLRGSETMRRAAHAEERLLERERIATRATHMLHETVLSDLVLMTMSDPGPLTDQHRAFLARDIASLAHPGLLVDVAMRTPAESEAEARSAGLQIDFAPVIRAARARGLRVTVSGDAAVLNDLGDPALSGVVNGIDAALAALTAYGRITEADLAIINGFETLNIVVTSPAARSGGFADEASRESLRHSIARHLHDFGGSVRVSSRPGSGTAVLMTIARGTVDSSS